MPLRKELRQRLAKEYRYAATRMQTEETQPLKQLFYFSVLYGEAQRVFNIQWDREVALVHYVAQAAYAQISAQLAVVGSLLPITWQTIGPQLTKATSDIATYFEKDDVQGGGRDLSEILGRITEAAYASTGNGAYLYEKGEIKF